MILFDYIYYLFAKLYRKSKEERDSDTWKFSGTSIVFITFPMFLTTFAVPILHWINHKDYFNPISGFIVYLLSVVYFSIRYKKQITFEKVKQKIKTLSIIQMILLQFGTFIYLLIAIPGCFFVVYYFGKSGQG